MKAHVSLAALCLALAAAPALADDDCDVPAERWQSREAVLAHAASQGWQVERLKIDDGCYEIRGRDDRGRAFKAKLDPETLSVMRMKRRDQERDGDDDDREHRRDRGGRRAHPTTLDAAPAPNAAPAPALEAGPAPSNPVLTPGTTPRGQIE